MSIFQGGSCSSSSSVLSSPGVSADEYDEEDDAFVVDATPLKKRKTEKDPPKPGAYLGGGCLGCLSTPLQMQSYEY